LKNSSELRRELRSEAELARRQAQVTTEIRTLWMKAADADETPPPRQEARGRLEEWRKKRELPDDSAERRLARRILNGLFVGAFETANAAARQKSYGAAAANLELARAVDPKNPNLSYELARVYALDGQKSRALQTLEEAVRLGFKDGVRLTSDAAFGALAGEGRFQKIVSALK
jgi:tetratricopeptide (TPR) repeat protein